MSDTTSPSDSPVPAAAGDPRTVLVTGATAAGAGYAAEAGLPHRLVLPCPFQPLGSPACGWP